MCCYNSTTLFLLIENTVFLMRSKIIEEKNNTKNDYLQIWLVLKECVSSRYKYNYTFAKIIPSDVLCGAN